MRLLPAMKKVGTVEVNGTVYKSHADGLVLW
jgi:hypothetical protein